MKNEFVFEEKKKNISELVLSYKWIIIIVILYIAGLLIGSVCYKYIDSSSLSDYANKLLEIKTKSIGELFINNLSLFLSVYIVSIVFGLCAIGFPVVSVLPIILGFTIGFKISFFYINYLQKGIGYCLLMIVPSISLFITLIIFLLDKSLETSRVIYQNTFKNTFEQTGIKEYLKSCGIYAIYVILISACDAALTTVFGSIISI